MEELLHSSGVVYSHLNNSMVGESKAEKRLLEQATREYQEQLSREEQARRRKELLDQELARFQQMAPRNIPYNVSQGRRSTSNENRTYTFPWPLPLIFAVRGQHWISEGGCRIRGTSCRALPIRTHSTRTHSSHNTRIHSTHRHNTHRHNFSHNTCRGRHNSCWNNKCNRRCSKDKDRE